jgi:hypothetical protein
MKYLYILISLLTGIVCKSQNLVPNPSFETYTICPNSGNQIEYAVPWNAATLNSSTEYFNSCSSGISGVPHNLSTGFQYAHSGNAYAGLIFYVGTNIREYLQVQLINPLVQNKIYYIEFYTNLSSVNWSSPCNNIAANLSMTRPYTSNYGDLQSLTPHIMISGNPVITDTLNWVQISGCYTAQGGEEYITIGNFFDNANTVSTGSTNASYYYIDDVRVEEISGTCVTGVNELAGHHYVNLFPNPNNGLFSIAYNFVDNNHVFKLYDLMGKKTSEKTLSGNEGIESINLHDMVPGIYFYKVLDENGNMLFSGKLVISE